MIRFLIYVVLFFVSCSSYSQASAVVEIKFEGLQRTKVSFLEKIITLNKGMTLDSTIIDDDIERLKRLPAIANATFDVLKLIDNQCEVIYTIDENFTLIPFANLFSSSNDDFAFRIGLQEFNFLGRNITLGGFYQLDVFNAYGLGIRAPNLFSTKTGLAFNYQDITTQEPVFFDNTTSDYKYNNRGFEVLGLHEINAKNKIELGFSLFTEKYQYLFGATNANVPQELKVNKHLIKLIYDYNTIKHFYQYLNGFRSALNLQYVGSTNENLPPFLIGFNDFTYFKRIGEKGNWASRLRFGLASNASTPFAPFTVDNNLNIRGVGNTIDRGTGAVVFNTEYRHTLIDEKWFVLQSNIFVDGGSWRLAGGDFSDFTTSDNIRIYPGVGLRLIHKKIFNAIFRIDYGYGITKDPSRGIVFGIGQYF